MWSMVLRARAIPATYRYSYLARLETSFVGKLTRVKTARPTDFL